MCISVYKAQVLVYVTAKGHIVYTFVENFSILVYKVRSAVGNVRACKHYSIGFVIIFRTRNVKDAKAFTLEELLTLLSNAAKNASKKAESEGVTVPSNIASLIKDIDRETSAEIANLKRVVAE